MENLKYKDLPLDEMVTPVFAKGDADFEHFCRQLTARPKFGYGPIEPEVDAAGHIVGFSYGLPANQQFEE